MFILGLLDGIWLSYRGIICTDLAESSKFANQANGYYHLFLFPMATSII